MSAPAIRDDVVRLDTVDPAAPDDDLGVLGDVVGDARVVLLGESAHFCSESIRLRDRFLRFLVRELGFTAFALESGLPEGLAVDRWVLGGDGDLGEVARTGIGYAFGRCEEMHAQLAWMRECGAVGFRGLDVPGMGADPGPGVAACLARVPSRPGDRELLAAASLGPVVRAPGPDGSGGPEVPAGLAERLAELVVRADDADDDLARRCAHGALRAVEFLSRGLYPGPGRNLRNEVMADNLRRLLDRDARVLVGAHNVHLQRSPSFDGTATVGMLLDDELGADMVVVGQTRAEVAVPTVDLDAAPADRYAVPAGEPQPAPAHTLDALLDAAGPELGLVDLRTTDPARLGGVTAVQGAYGIDVELDPRRAFDAVVHIRATTPARGADD